MQVSGGERALAILGYLPILWIIPLLGKKSSLFVQFHARQGMVLFLLWFAASVVLVVLLWVFESGPLNVMAFLLLFVATLVYAGAALLTILFKVIPGERYRMPVVADVALKMRL